MSSQIKEAFISRFDGGYLLEADFGQLEVYALAYLSQDKQLKQDLLDGLDLHCVNAAALINQPYAIFKGRVDGGDYIAINQRKLAKTMSFQLQYGAGAAKIAKENGCTEDFARKFIRLYYERYSGVKAYHDEMLVVVPRLRRPSDKRTSSGLPAGYSCYHSHTGRMYTFYEEDSYKGVSFSPTQIKNYPVQGFATGDIVPLVLGHLHNYLCNDVLTEHILLINTIHDSILEDVKPNYVHIAADRTKRIMEQAPELLRQYFNIDLGMPLKAEIKVGKTWATMENYDDTRSY
jgi:DNA polymerase I-like protein with 3'-5' exonuclease and polymerase domains